MARVNNSKACSMIPECRWIMMLLVQASWNELLCVFVITTHDWWSPGFDFILLITEDKKVELSFFFLAFVQRNLWDLNVSQYLAEISFPSSPVTYLSFCGKMHFHFGSVIISLSDSTSIWYWALTTVLCLTDNLTFTPLPVSYLQRPLTLNFCHGAAPLP